MDSRSRLALTVAATAILGVGGLALAVSRPGSPLPTATLVLLAAVGTASLLVPVPITDRGASTSVQYLPVLAAMVVAGPAGAGMVAAASHGCAAALDRRRPLRKAVYNVAQVTLAGVVAGAVFLATGGAVGAGAALADRIFPFLAAPRSRPMPSGGSWAGPRARSSTRAWWRRRSAWGCPASWRTATG